MGQRRRIEEVITRSERLGLPRCFFVTDLHGQADRFGKLFASILNERPEAVFLGGDLLPRASSLSMHADKGHSDFVIDYLVPSFTKLRDALDREYPSLFVILGNDDPRYEEPEILNAATNGLWTYMHGRKAVFAGFNVYGYACVPPTPFSLKDWERYDVSRYVDPGCISPEEGRRSVAIEESDVKWGTIAKDLDMVVDDDSMDRAIFYFILPRTGPGWIAQLLTERVRARCLGRARREHRREAIYRTAPATSYVAWSCTRSGAPERPVEGSTRPHGMH